jgi:hypothetical protein
MKIIFTLLGVLLFTLSLQAQFTSPNTGVRWTLDSIAAHSPLQLRYLIRLTVCWKN